MALATVKAIPFKNFKEKIEIVKKEQASGAYVEVADKYIYALKYDKRYENG